jgi:hypothetical protein
VLVALLGGLFTYVYNQWQLSAQQPWQPASPTTGQTVHSDGTSSSCSSSPCTYTWQDDGPDGSGGTNYPLGTGATLDFVFQGAGTKYVRLTVKDRRNRISTVEHDVVVTTAPPPTTCAQQPFCGDLETGDTSQWSFTPSEGTGTWQAVTSPVAQGTYAGQFTDTPDYRDPSVNANKDRFEADLSRDAGAATVGQDWYYGWWSRFPLVDGQPQSWWNLGSGWNDFAQFNEENGARWIYMGIDATRTRTPYDNIYLNTYAGNHVLQQIQYDHWYHFVLHVHWATDATGHMTLDVDGNTVWDEANPTLPADNPYGRLSLGMYRGAWPATNTVIHDGFCRAATYTDAAAC